MAKKKTTKLEGEGLKLDITRSYYRKLNMSMHGGQQYETTDFGATYTAKDVDSAESEAVSKVLEDLAKLDVETAISALDKLMIAENKPSKPAQPAQDIPSKEELAGISDVLNKMIAAKSKAELKEVGEEIKDNQSLSPTQIDYLKKKYIQINTNLK